MVFISKKKIKNKERYYLEQSTRLVNGKVKKISVYLKDYDPNKEYKQFFQYKAILKDRIKKELKESAAKYYKKSHIFNEELLRNLEEIKLEYKEIIKKLNKKQINDIVDRFTVNFTYESNAIEGNSLTLKDVNFILNEKKLSKEKDLREVYETLNTREAMDLIFNNKLKIKENDIIKMHKIIVKNTGISAGYKTLPNFLVGRKVETTKPEKVKIEMKKLIQWYNKNKNLHPLERATIFHGKFEKIHPFEDGNGRIGRLSINIILLNNGYPPIIIRKTQRLSYFSCLEAFDSNHQDKLNRFLIDKYKSTFNKFFRVYVKYLK